MFRTATLRLCAILFALTILTDSATAFAQSSASSADPIEIQYDLDRAGRISAAIYDGRGVLVRELRRARSQSAGDHTIRWDGLDQAGRPVSPGTYKWKLLQTQGMKAEYLLSIGTSFRHKHWPSQHGGPYHVATSEDAIFTRGSPEGSPLLVKVSRDGEYQWAMEEFELPGLVDMIERDGRLYLLNTQGIVHIFSSADGKRIGKFDAQVPSHRFDLSRTNQNTPDDWQFVPLQTHTEKTGIGWSRTEQMQATTRAEAPSDDATAPEAVRRDFHGSETLAHNTFRIDIKNGRYMLRLHTGDTQRALGPMRVIAEPPRYRRFAPKLATKQPGDFGHTLAPYHWRNPVPAKVEDGTLDIRLESTGDEPAPWALNGVELLVGPAHFDVRGNTMLAVYPQTGMLAWLDAESGQTHTHRSINGVKDAVLLESGRALALLNERVIEIARNGSSHPTRITGLTSPQRIRRDGVTGDIFIIEHGNSQQIKRYNADIQHVATYGRKGGRRQGAYVAEDFRSVHDLAGDGNGGFVIAEGQVAPRRTAHFDADGELLKEWYGGQLFFTYLSVDPRDPSIVWFDSHWGWIVQARVDYEAGTWQPLATYKVNGLGDGIIPSKGNARGGWDVRHRQGRTYLLHTGASPQILLVDKKNHQLKALAASDPSAAYHLHKEPDAVKARFPKGKQSQHASFVWADANGDGRPQPDELRLSEWKYWNISWHVDDKFNYQGIIFNRSDRTYRRIDMPVKRWRDGVPIYPTFDEAARRPFELDRPTLNADTLQNIQDHTSLPDSDDRLMVIPGGGDSFQAKGTYGGAHGERWPANRLDATSIARLDPNGQLQWRVGALAPRDPAAPGHMYCPIGIAGVIRGCVGIANRIGQPCEFWTTDGLYVGGLFDRRANDGLPERVYHWWRRDKHAGDDFETNSALLQYDMLVGGQLIEGPDGRALFFGAGWNNVPVYAVTGFDQFTRQRGRVTVHSASRRHARSKGSGLRAAYYRNADFEGDPALRRIDERLWFDAHFIHKPRRNWPENAPSGDTFSARWTGELEPRFTEAYRFGLYLGWTDQRTTEPARLWIDGELVIDTVTHPRKRKPAGEKKQLRVFSEPIELQAGETVPIRVEYTRTGRGTLHLVWQSRSQPIEHVPTTALYPQ